MRLLDRIVGAIEHASAVDKPANKVAEVVDGLFEGERVRDTLSGTWLGHPLHPLMITLPIGSWAAASVFDLSGDKKLQPAAQRLVGLGLLSAVPTAAAGLSDWRYTMGPERRVGAVHAVANTVAMGFYGASWLARRKGAHGTGTVLALAGATAMSVGGYLGGHLSYAMGVGVDATSFENLPDSWTTVARRDEVAPGAMVERQVNGVSLLVSEVNGEITALANRCSHRGGPLSEGKRDGDCVRCPWHDSVFSLETGEVNLGPATRPQPSYEVRVVNGDIQVREGKTSALRRASVGAAT